MAGYAGHTFKTSIPNSAHFQQPLPPQKNNGRGWKWPLRVRNERIHFQVQVLTMSSRHATTLFLLVVSNVEAQLIYTKNQLHLQAFLIFDIVLCTPTLCLCFVVHHTSIDSIVPGVDTKRTQTRMLCGELRIHSLPRYFV